MAQLQRSSVQVAIGFESAYGVPTTTAFKVPLASVNASTTQAINSSTVISGNASPSQPFLGFKDGVVNVSVPVDDKAFAYWLKGLFDSPTTTNVGEAWATSQTYTVNDIIYTSNSTTLALKVTTGGTTGGSEPDLTSASAGDTVNDGGGSVVYTVIERPYKHTYKITNSVPSMFLELQHSDAQGGLYYTTNGIGINTLSLSLGGDGELLATIEGIAKDTTQSTTSPLNVTDATDGGKFGQFTASLTGVDKVRTFDLNYSNNIDGETYIIDGTASRGGVPKDIASVSGTFAALFENDSLYAKSRAFETTALDVEMTLGDSILKFDMQENKFDAISNAEIGGDAGLIATLNFQSFYADGSNQTALQVELTNTLATI